MSGNPYGLCAISVVVRSDIMAVQNMGPAAKAV